MHLRELLQKYPYFQKNIHEWLVGGLFAMGALFLVIAGSIAYARLGSLTSPLIVNFDVFNGVNLIGSKTLVYNSVGIGFAILCVNYLLFRAVLPKSTFLAYFIAAGTLMTLLVILIGVSVIVHFNV